MKLTEYTDRSLFIELAEPFLLKNEAENNLTLGLIGAFKRTIPAANVYTAAVEADGELAMTLLMTPPHNLILSFNEDLMTENLLHETIRTLVMKDLHIPGVVGERKWTEAFAKIWSAETEDRAEIVMEQKIYRLQEVTELKRSDGEFVLAELGHLPLLTEWMMDFMNYTNEPPITVLQAAGRMKQFIAEKSVFLWMADDKPVSMAKKSRSTKNGICVSLVYTPDEFRGKGYASSCVAELSELLLKDFSFCTLYTDLANPTSNSIYQKIGYQPIQDSIMITFS
ncbi:GNAT family N-acetyltransferase [Metabacillus idriensis]|uniref:GNAT family N-acetyltransferase n=1 Tax=Metabacillus idriensis TaxID=324768 RepID=A0A6I2MI87_9BACI|nr:GNAT family N-acetyltransferase [Metabacillus idriensis]MCM3595881.1 GNAT family N-acetyltransferase [Metabacillus idriensis]MRX56211.1 GNAT family N-acetyltransferase [Metabacillus idriensis]